MDWILNERQACDLEMIFNGAFSPLKGFMNRKEYLNVLEYGKLPNGNLWPLPITLTVKDTLFTNSSSNSLLKLYYQNKLVGILHIEDIYKPDLEYEFEKSLGTTDPVHPYIEYIKSLGEIVYVGGYVEKILDIPHYDFVQYRILPEDLKKEIKKYERVIGFQTRNPIHNCHYQLSIQSYNEIESDNKLLLLSPVVGVTQDNDIDYHIRVRCYIHIMKKYEEEKINAKLILIPLSMRMAGPKEALLHAIIRKNYGCTDFIIGRDHAGPSAKKKDGTSFYGEYDAQDFVLSLSKKIGINIIRSDNLLYDSNQNKYVSENKVDTKNVNNISGSELRKRLKNNEEIPLWFTIPTISKELRKSYKNENRGKCFYLIGLSGSGKTEIANALYSRLQEKYLKNKIVLLDGDVIRANINSTLGFSRKDRSINTRQIGYMASLVVQTGGIAICSNIAPYYEDRLHNRNIISKVGKYIEIYVSTPLEVCEKRDVKGLYKKARSGEIKEFTGITDPFEIPQDSEVIVNGEGDLNKIIDKILLSSNIF